MGDYFKQTFEKCVLGIADAAIHGRPVSPSTEENCAVAAREFREAIENAPPPPPAPKPKEEKKTHFQARDVKHLRKLVPELKQRSRYPLLQENKSYDPLKFRETVEKFLESGSTGNGPGLLKTRPAELHNLLLPLPLMPGELHSLLLKLPPECPPLILGILNFL